MMIKSLVMMAAIGASPAPDHGGDVFDHPFYDSCIKGAKMVGVYVVKPEVLDSVELQEQIEQACMNASDIEGADTIRRGFPNSSYQDRVEVGCGVGAGMMGASWARSVGKNPGDYIQHFKEVAVKCVKNQLHDLGQ